MVRNSSILLAREHFNNQYYTRMNIDLHFINENRPNVLLCYFDCTNEQPRIQTDPLALSYTSPPQLSSHRRLVRLQEPISEQVMYNNIYLLGGSSIAFTATGFEYPFELHIVTSNDLTFSNCYNFLHQKSNLSFRHFILNETNEYTANFIVPPGMNGGYYCAVILVPPNSTINYSIDAHVNMYDINFYQHMERATCVNPIPGTVFNPTSYTINIHTSLKEQYTCVLLAQFNDLNYVQARIHILPTLFNPVFGLLLTAACVSFVIIPCVCAICCLTVCRNHLNRLCYCCSCRKSSGSRRDRIL